MPELDRRDFLKLVGASAGAAAAAGCSDPVEKLIPYVVQPEEILPGVSNQYASTCTECSVSCGLHVTARDGRPIKLEGNPDHPINQGRLCAQGQVSIGRAYHPDRIEGPVVMGSGGPSPISWEDAQAKVAGKVQSAGARMWVLGGPVGPTLSGLIDEFVMKLGGGGRVTYEAFANDSLRAASNLVFGRNSVPLFDLRDADLVLDFSSDFLDQGLSPVEHAWQLADAKDLKKHPDGGARLIAFGPRLSMSGSKADEWISTSPGGEGALALALAAEIYKKRGASAVPGDGGAVQRLLGSVDSKELAGVAGVDSSAFGALVETVLHAKSAVALPPGVSATSTQGTSDAAAVLLLNGLLGSVGTHVQIPERETADHGASMAEIKRLIASMEAGRVDVLLIHDCNPAYSLPASLGFEEALKSTLR